MAREICSALLIALLFAAALCNVRHIDRLTQELTAEIQQSQAEAEDGELEAARVRLDACLSRWTEAKSYTYASMRHEEIDGVADALCQLLEALADGDAESIGGGYARAYYRLSVIGEREHISAKSIF